MIYKKSVVLTSLCGGKQKAVVTLEYDNGETLGNVRLYNFEKEPNGILSLGILHNQKVTKAGLTKENNGFYSFKINGENNFNSFSCALVNFVNGDAKPLLMGSTNGISETEEGLCNALNVFDQKPTVKDVEENLNQNKIYLEDQEEIDEQIDQILETENACATCKYRDAFFKQEDDTSPAPVKEDTFFDNIEEQINELFNKYPEDEILKQIIPESKWVKIDYEEKGEYYVVGLLYENGKIKYVCYGVPSTKSALPPEDIKGFCEWLPIDTEKEDGFGYYITYQDAETGENVKLNYEVL